MTLLSYDDITLVPRYNNITSRREVDTSVKFGDLILKAPIMSANMDTVTGDTMARKMYELGGLGFLHRFCTIEENIEMYLTVHHPAIHDGEAVVSLGVNEGLQRFSALHEVGARYFCVDVAHGHSRAVGDMVKAIKNADPNVFVVAGNVCTSHGAEYLAEVGADAIKVGIGPGSACTTRVKTGFGVPQFSALLDCSSINCFIIADGGIRTPGDAVKAFVAGANAIMLGGMLAGTDETPGELFSGQELRFSEGRTYGMLPPMDHYKIFRGMASKEAQDEFMGTMNEWKTAEGIEMKVACKGPVRDVIADIMGGLRSGMTYCGANNLGQMTRAKWKQITAAGAAEGQAHGKNRL